MNHIIPLSTPTVGHDEEVAVLRALRSGWIAPAGPELTLFEEELALACGRRHAVALASGTGALHLALLAHGIGPGDVVACATMTFAATANAIVYTGATPLFVDCDETGNIDPELLAAEFRERAGTQGAISAVVPVDLLGKMADYRRICALADRYRVPVISDAAESLGATKDGVPAGSRGDTAILSFNGNKIITSSGGGAVVCDDESIADRVRHLATQARQPFVHYEHTEIGFNYRLSNLLAALGRAQLARLPEFLAARRSHRDAYRDMSWGIAGLEIFGGDDTGDNCWLSAIVVDPEVAGFTSAELAAELTGHGIETRPVWKPMHLQPVFADPRKYPRTVNGTSERHFGTALTLPSGANLTPDDRATVIGRIASFAQQRCAVATAAGYQMGVMTS